jgi:hypothetical protein
MRTCLVVHSQDGTAEHLLGCRLQNTPTECGTNLYAVKLETSKVCFDSASLSFFFLLLFNRESTQNLLPHFFFT